MERETEIAVVPEARERVLALRTNRGELIPLLEDVRARAFRRDERLRNMEVELVVVATPIRRWFRSFVCLKSPRMGGTRSIIGVRFVRLRCFEKKAV